MVGDGFRCRAEITNAFGIGAREAGDPFGEPHALMIVPGFKLCGDGKCMHERSNVQPPRTEK
jgi:hypothetical protein